MEARKKWYTSSAGRMMKLEFFIQRKYPSRRKIKQTFSNEGKLRIFVNQHTHKARSLKKDLDLGTFLMKKKTMKKVKI